MTDILGVIDGLSWPVKVGWVLWFAWVGLQVVWYQRARVEAAAVRPVDPARETVARIAADSRVSTSTATARASSTDTARAGSTDSRSTRTPVRAKPTGGSPEFLAELGLLEDDDDERDRKKGRTSGV
jgi:hypothetical protein